MFELLLPFKCVQGLETLVRPEAYGSESSPCFSIGEQHTTASEVDPMT